MSRRYVYGVAAILAFTAAYACWCRAPLIWDGAYQFNATLIMQRPYFYLTRFHSYFLWWPTVWASRLTTNMTLLETIYGLPFLLAPVAGLLLSWWMVHKHAPQLIIWAVFGVAAGTLPGQIFVINDSIFQLHLFWPVFMGMFVPLSWLKKIVLAGLIAFQFVHPLGIVLLLGAAAAMLLLAGGDRENRHAWLMRAGFMAFFCLAAAAKVYVTTRIPRLHDSFAEQEAHWHVAVDRWRAGVRGWPLRGLWLMWASGTGAFLHRYWVIARKPAQAVLAGLLGILCAAAAAACWIYWAGDGRLWWKALDYRRWVGPLTAPFFILATLEVYLTIRSRSAPATTLPAEVQAMRNPLAIVLATTFAIVLGLQCTIFHSQTSRLMADVRNYPSPVVPESAVSWTTGGPLDHWASADFVMAMQGKQPTKLLLDPRGEDHIYMHPPKFPHWDFYPHAKIDHPDPTPGPIGWFDLRPYLKHLATLPQPKLHHGHNRLDIQSTPD